MKKVLIIASIFHSSPRLPGLVKYLPGFGYEPLIITIPREEIPLYYLGGKDYPLGVRIIETPCGGDILRFWRRVFRLFGFNQNKSVLTQIKEKVGATSKKTFIDRLLIAYQTVFAYPDEEKKWKKPGIKAANDLLKKENFSAIISSSSPVTSHIIASRLRQEYRIPWLADFRDLWTQNHDYPYPRCRKFFEKRLELKTIQPADALSATSEFWAEKLKNLHKKENVYTITNGFDPDTIDGRPEELTEKFTITHTGQIYAGKQDPLKILTALKELIEEGLMDRKDIEFRLYGPERTWLEKEIKKYGLSDIARQYGTVPRDVSLKKQPNRRCREEASPYPRVETE